MNPARKEHFANALRRARESMGLSRQELATVLTAVGRPDDEPVTYRMVESYENGFRVPTSEFLARLSALLDVPMDELWPVEVTELDPLSKIEQELKLLHATPGAQLKKKDVERIDTLLRAETLLRFNLAHRQPDSNKGALLTVPLLRSVSPDGELIFDQKERAPYMIGADFALRFSGVDVPVGEGVITIPNGSVLYFRASNTFRKDRIMALWSRSKGTVVVGKVLTVGPTEIGFSPEEGGFVVVDKDSLMPVGIATHVLIPLEGNEHEGSNIRKGVDEEAGR